MDLQGRRTVVIRNQKVIEEQRVIAYPVYNSGVDRTEEAEAANPPSQVQTSQLLLSNRELYMNSRLHGGSDGSIQKQRKKDRA